MKSQCGFITVWMISLIPLGLIILILVSAIGFVRLEYSRKLHICRTGLLELQQDVAKATNQLVILNPQAQRLRHQRQISDNAVKVGLQNVPYLGIAVSVHRAATIAAQYALKAKQDFILKQTPLKALQKLWDIRLQMMKFRNSQPDSSVRITYDSPKFKLIKSPSDSLTPDYNPSPDFEHIEALIIRFSFDPNYCIKHLTNFFETPYINKAKSTLWAECSATVHEEEDHKWYPILGTGKSL